MTEPIKYIDIKEFSDEGYVQEVNRRFLHPLGLALEWSSGWTEEEVGTKISEEEGHNQVVLAFGGAADEDDVVFARQLIFAFLCLVGLDRPRISGVWDYRGDPEGIRYEKLDLQPKADNVDRIWRERKRSRVELLGYMVQPRGRTEFQGGLLQLLARALSSEFQMLGGSELTWLKTAKGVLDKLTMQIAEERFAPSTDDHVEVDMIDLALMSEGVGPIVSSNSRVEAVVGLANEARAWRGMAQEWGAVAHEVREAIIGGVPPSEVVAMLDAGVQKVAEMIAIGTDEDEEKKVMIGTDEPFVFDDYQGFTATTAIYPGQGTNLGIVYCALGLTGESGEVAEKVKKWLRSGGYEGEEGMPVEARAAIKKELGDVLWYVSQLCTELGLGLAEVVDLNIEKLSARREAGVLHGEGDDR